MSKNLPVPSPQGGNAVVSAAQLAEWQADAGQGAEEIRPQDIAVPFIGHVQALSKQLAENDPKYLPDAKIGTLFNTVTGEIFSAKDGIHVVPAELRRIVVEKQPKERGGKIVATYNTRAEAQENAESGNELLDGFRVFLLYQTVAGGWSPAIMSFGTKSKIYTMKHWNALLTGLRVPGPNGTPIQPPIFAWTYRITSAQQEFDDGTAAVLKVSPVGPTRDDVYQQVKKFRAALAEGAVKVATETDDEVGESKDDDLPY